MEQIKYIKEGRYYVQARDGSPRPSLLLQGCSADLQDEQEDLNNVDVEGEGSVDVLLWAEGQLAVTQEELGVVGQELRQHGRHKTT